MKALASIVSVLIVLAAAPSNAVALEFSAAKNYPVGTAPVAIAVADFNGDGKPDLAVANSGSNNVSVLLNNGDGTFQAAVNYSAGAAPVAVLAGDFNGDGKQDLIVANTGSLSLLKGNGDGTFQSAVSITAGSNPKSLAAGDFNGDKKLDLVVGDATAGVVNVLIGNGDGTFQPPTSLALATSGPVNSVVAADLNGDSNLDLVVSVPGGPVSLLGKGDGTFQAAIHVDSGTSNGTLLVADLDGDLKTDLVVRAVVRTLFLSVDTITFYRGNGDGTFQTGVRVFSSLPAVLSNVATADFNADNKLDIAFGRVASGIFYLGKGDGTFLSTQSVATASGPNFVAVGDFNVDKKPDLAVANQVDGSVTILLNVSPASGADLGVTTTASSEPAVAIQNLTYTMNVTNTGPQDATNVTLTDPLPASMTFVSATPSQGTCTGTTTVSCNLGAMVSPSRATLSLVVTPTQAGSFTNTVTVAATEPDLAPANDTASVTSTILLPADLVLTKTASASSVASGSNITYTLTVNNKGPASATNVVLTDAPSFNFPIVSAMATQGSCAPDASTGNVTCNIGSVGVGASATATIVVKAGSPAMLVNNASVVADQPDLGNTSASVTVTVNPAPDFSFSAASASLSAQAGGTVTDQLSFAAQNGFSSAIQLTCNVTGPAPAPTCSLSPQTIPAGANSATSTLTVNVPVDATLLMPSVSDWHIPPVYSYATPFTALILAFVAWCSRRRRRSWLLAGSYAAIALALFACGGGSSTPPVKAYSIVVTASSTSGSGPISHTTAISLTVR